MLLYRALLSCRLRNRGDIVPIASYRERGYIGIKRSDFIVHIGSKGPFLKEVNGRRECFPLQEHSMFLLLDLFIRRWGVAELNLSTWQDSESNLVLVRKVMKS